MKEWVVLAFMVCAGTPAFAQTEPQQQSLPVRKYVFNWDLLLRYDDLTDVPLNPALGGPLSHERTRLQFRPGVLFTPVPWATMEARVAVHADSDDDEEYPLADRTSKRVIRPDDHLTYTGRQDNFEPNSVVIDRLNLQLRPSAGSMIEFGKFEVPFDVTEAVWDHDIQPEGLAGSIDFGPVDELHYRVTAGTFFGTQLYGDDSTIMGAQASFFSGTSWPIDASVSLGWFTFDDLEVLAQRNWRQNRTAVVSGVREFVSDYEIGDVLLRIGSDRFGVPIQLHYDWIRNFGAFDDGEGKGMEAGLRVGPFTNANLRFSYTYQDLDRDAVMAGFNTDDWYLHSWYRGNLYRASATLWREYGLQATYMQLWHHDTVFETNRMMLDLVKRF